MLIYCGWSDKSRLPPPESRAVPSLPGQHRRVVQRADLSQTAWDWILAPVLISHVILAHYLTSPCLSFHICKMGIITVCRQEKGKRYQHRLPHGRTLKTCQVRIQSQKATVCDCIYMEHPEQADL